MNTTNIQSQQELLDALVGFVTGKELISYPESERERVTEEVLTLVYTYITTYVEEEYGIKESIRVKKMLLDGDLDILDTFPHTRKVFLQSLLKMVEKLS